MDLLTIENVSKQYANHIALDNVSLSVKEKSIFGLLGPNGAGKTSLIRIINQITGPDSGRILFDGEQLNSSHIARIGYLPEERGLYKKMEVGEQVMYLAQLKGLSKSEARQKLKYWFEKFGIESWWTKKIEELSKGMAQKVQFIVTVLHDPKLLILDEPFSGFDPINANLLKKEILELRDKGTTIIFSTHNMGSVEELCDHIALIHRSKKILDGPVDEIRRKHLDGVYEIEFKGNSMAFTNALWTGAELLDKPVAAGTHFKAKIKLAGTTKINDILMAIIPYVEVKGLKEHIPSINEIFISAVGGNSETIEMDTNAALTE